MEVDKRKESILIKLAKYGADTEKKVIAIDKVEVIEFCLSSGLKLEDVHTVYEIQDAMKDNPSGQGGELTPLILIRPLN